jgi:hypothetical protein
MIIKKKLNKKRFLKIGSYLFPIMKSRTNRHTRINKPKKEESLPKRRDFFLSLRKPLKKI